MEGLPGDPVLEGRAAGAGAGGEIGVGVFGFVDAAVGGGEEMGFGGGVVIGREDERADVGVGAAGGSADCQKEAMPQLAPPSSER